MSSIESAVLDWFFKARLLPAARRVDERGAPLLRDARADDSASWYVSCSGREMDLVPAGDAGLDGLERMWVESEWPEFVALMGGLRRLQRAMRTREDDTGVSPFIYVMY